MAISRSRPTASRISSQAWPVRWSFHRIAGRSTRSSASSSTRPCIWPVSPTAATSSPRTPVASSTARTASWVASHHSAGSCSLHSGLGVSNPYSAWPTPATAPAGSTRIALVAVVETSTPRTCPATASVPRARPDRPVDDVLVQLLLARARARDELAGGHPRLEVRERQRAAEDRAAQLAAPGGVALLHHARQRPLLDQRGRREQRLGQRVEAADVGMEQVAAVAALAPQLGVEVEPAPAEAA